MTSVATAKMFPGPVKAMIMQAVMEVLNDPDFGLELTEGAKKRLRKAASSKKKGIPFSVIKKKYG